MRMGRAGYNHSAAKQRRPIPRTTDRDTKPLFIIPCQTLAVPEPPPHVGYAHEPFFLDLASAPCPAHSQEMLPLPYRRHPDLRIIFTLFTH